MRNTIPYDYKINPLLLIFGSLFVVIIPFCIWASWAELDQISHAQGQVMATAKTQTIQSPIDGVISDILVKEGQKVTEKELLISLEKDKGKAAYDDSKSKVAALKAALVRLHAEVYGKELSFPSEIQKEYPEFVSNQKELFKKRQKALHDETAALQESLSLVEEELKNTLPLLKTGDIGSSEIIRLKKQVADLKGQIANKINKYFQDSQSEMTKIEEDLSSKEQEFTDRKITLEWADIYSPMDAIVKNILITTKGARVRGGDIIMELVPFGDTLLIEAKLPPTDISFVKKGQRAAVKLDAYDYSIYGIFDGEVVYISPDTLIEKTAQGEKPYFRVHIKLDQTKLIAKNGKAIEVSPGMTTQVDIITGSRTVLRYLTKPITKTLSEAFHEK
ncbi:MAG: HlyD family efflux transporter periplasmic adaptor subunit [Sulfurospirillaceae bacterium]|nr:HlyD family efflux transporter periplasmic adaptor subunit [Sulfurospirillaceae bacterium]MDD2825945.1 HlyD family efflux transporter periplasmic adaptor subunit [Sulfurospirillaceae bacterium]